MIKFYLAADLERWKRAFPDNSNTPACYTHDLLVGCLEVVTVADAGKDGWIPAFSRVTHRVVNSFSGNPGDRPTAAFLITFHGFSPSLKRLRILSDTLSNSQILHFVSTLPHLEDLSVASIGSDNEAPGSDGSLTVAQPQSSCPFTGTLELAITRGVDTMTRWLLGQPNGLHFRNLVVSWINKDDLQLMNALVGGCTDTLETFSVVETFSVAYYLSGAPVLFLCPTCCSSSFVDEHEPVPIDLSGATELRGAHFLISSLGVGWITRALQTITHNYRDFRHISFDISDINSLTHVDIRRDTRVPAFSQWSELDRLLVQFWDTRSIRLEINYYALGEKWEKMDGLAKGLLPEMAKRGLIDAEGPSRYPIR